VEHTAQMTTIQTVTIQRIHQLPAPTQHHQLILQLQHLLVQRRLRSQLLLRLQRPLQILQPHPLHQLKM